MLLCEPYFFTRKMLFLPDDNADIFAAALLMSCCNFSSLSLIAMIFPYTDSNRSFRKRNGLPDRKVVSMTKNEYDSAVSFL